MDDSRRLVVWSSRRGRGESQQRFATSRWPSPSYG